MYWKCAWDNDKSKQIYTIYPINFFHYCVFLPCHEVAIYLAIIYSFSGGGDWGEGRGVNAECGWDLEARKWKVA